MIYRITRSKALRTLPVLALITTSFSLATAVTASADLLGHSCAGSYNPKDPLSGVNEYQEHRNADIGKDRHISLMAGWTRGARTYVGWAEISGYKGKKTAGSDRVWLDWSNNAHRDWYQCGPYSVDIPGTIGFTRAEPADSDNPNRQFRACGDILVGGRRQSNCTPWW